MIYYLLLSPKSFDLSYPKNLFLHWKIYDESSTYSKVEENSQFQRSSLILFFSPKWLQFIPPLITLASFQHNLWYKNDVKYYLPFM